MGTRAVRSARNRLRAGSLRVRAGRLALLRLSGLVEGGAHCRIGRGVRLELYGTLRLGERVLLDDGCSLHVAPGASLELGDGVYVGRHTVVAAATRVAVGHDSMIGENASIRDADHSLDPELRRREWSGERHAAAEPLEIGSDVWIGAGARVLRGASIGDGAVVAANAVVREPVPSRTVVAGVPARVVREL